MTLTREQFLDGVECEVDQSVHYVDLSIAHAPVCPVAGDLTVSHGVEPAGVSGHVNVEPCFEMVTIAELARMRCRYIVTRNRAIRLWADLGPELQSELNAALGGNLDVHARFAAAIPDEGVSFFIQVGREDILRGLEAKVDEWAQRIELVCTTPCCPKAGEMLTAEVELKPVCDEGAAGWPVVATVRGHGDVTEPQLRRMCARFLVIKNRLLDAWERLEPALRAEVDKPFFAGKGDFTAKLKHVLPPSKHHFEVKTNTDTPGTATATCPTCHAEEDIYGDPMKMVRFIAKHSRCGVPGAPPPPEFEAEETLTIVVFDPGDPPAPPEPRRRGWRLYSYKAKSPRGERLEVEGDEVEVRQRFDQAKTPRPGSYLRLVDPAGAEIDRKPRPER